MAAWLYETHDRQSSRAAVVNAAMCVLALPTIVDYRFWYHGLEDTP